MHRAYRWILLINLCKHIVDQLQQVNRLQSIQPAVSTDVRMNYRQGKCCEGKVTGERYLCLQCFTMTIHVRNSSATTESDGLHARLQERTSDRNVVPAQMPQFAVCLVFLFLFFCLEALSMLALRVCRALGAQSTLTHLRDQRQSLLKRWAIQYRQNLLYVVRHRARSRELKSTTSSIFIGGL